MTTISIITATYNAAPTVADCLHSVVSQTHPSEQIIIDGASCDSTLEIVRRVSPSALILSEPDRGIYDAMNKGIALATGEVIGILNADDFYASPSVLEKVARAFEDPAVMSCYGDLEYVKECSGTSNGFYSGPLLEIRHVLPGQVLLGLDAAPSDVLCAALGL